jgi:hypothetical protein
MELIWDIKLYQLKSGKYRVVLKGDDPWIGIHERASADASTPHQAYTSACAKLVVKPWLESTQP